MELTCTNRPRAYPSGGLGRWLWVGVSSKMVFGFEGMSRAARGAGQGFQQAPYAARIVLDSSMVEHAAVNRGVVGSSPTRGAKKACKHRCLQAFVF